MHVAGNQRARRSLRVAAIMMLLATAATSASSGCHKSPTRADDAHEVDPGPNFGAELRVTVIGRGRVSTNSPSIDCPDRCFASILFRQGELDAGNGVPLVAEPTAGAHFVGWKFESLLLGLRGQGPETCSPMKRESSVPIVDMRSPRITLPFGQTRAWPPFGREADCEGYTTVSVGYAVTATFEENLDASVDSGDAGVEVLFTTPSPGVEAHELGIVDGRLYWRFQTTGDLRSGIATGLVTGGPAEVVVVPADPITAFHVGGHVAFQRATAQTTQWLIPSGAVTAGPLNGLTGYYCDAFASTVDKIYCRITFSGGYSSIYSWPPSINTSSTYVYQLPSRGVDLAVDDSFLYFSEDQGGIAEAAIIRSEPRINPGGPIIPFPRVVGQTSPRSLRVSSSYLFWLDGVTTGTASARAAPKTGTNVRESVAVPGARLLAPDPDSSEGVFFAGVFTVAEGFSIVRASLTSTTPFRTKLAALGGLAVDSSYVYWTQGDDRIYRARK